MIGGPGSGGQLVSVNVGMPVESTWQGRSVTSGIFKSPVDGAVAVRAMGLAGDRQADLAVHGGELKAVYAYPAEHYDYWHAEHAPARYPWGMFGENLTTRGLSERTVAVGDRLRVGGAMLMVTQPRMPCSKLEMRFNRPGLAREFLASGRSGFYLLVREEGTIRAGDGIELIPRDGDRVTIAEVVAARSDPAAYERLVERIARMADLPGSIGRYYVRWGA